jgi:hypothetical protein
MTAADFWRQLEPYYARLDGTPKTLREIMAQTGLNNRAGILFGLKHAMCHGLIEFREHPYTPTLYGQIIRRA